MRILSAASTDPGLRRDSNEDSFSLRPTLGLFVVADGMGGHAAGEVASHVAVDAIEAFVEHTAGQGEQATWPFGYNAALGVDGNRLSSAFRLANRQIQQRAADDAALHGMATTAVALLIAQPPAASGEARIIRGLVAHVGDSRAYLWHEGRLEQITRDHSWVEEQIAAGSMTTEDARRHPWRNLVTRALAGAEDPDVEITPVALQPGDRFLLCSDGLSTPVPDSAIAAIMARATPGEPGPLCATLIETAIAAGGPDNITVVVAEVTAQ
ncbi:MAG: protein phosphatase 2C domain-containing protein [Acidobacteria bacterium]|nr:protein phosphatase 2C domain-containing protein [Acidobacteriota bacterium]